MLNKKNNKIHELSNCIKCGQNDIITRFIKKGEYLDVICGLEKGKAENDCLYRHCRTCQYYWTEKTYEETLLNQFINIDKLKSKKL